MEGSCRAAQLVFVFSGQLLGGKKRGFVELGELSGNGKAVTKEWRGREEGARKVSNSVHPQVSCKNFLMCRF